MVLEMLVSVTHFAVTTPAILVICLGATLFLLGVASVAMMFYRRTSASSFNRSKGGVFLTDAEDSTASPGFPSISEQEQEHILPPLRMLAPNPKRISRLLFTRKSTKFRFDFLAPPPAAGRFKLGELVQLHRYRSPPRRNSLPSLKQDHEQDMVTKV